MNLRIELEQERDGRWIAEVISLPGVMAYGATSQDALTKVKALALRVLADRIEHGETTPEILSVSFEAA
ncbi:MAG: type II toxin-antitoxin system HicB family antitoxin [Chloroflexi bacterium]|nr:type II toxin-antitoxin system HicB family antitoxin [Chloroflexota bacterium]